LALLAGSLLASANSAAIAGGSHEVVRAFRFEKGAKSGTVEGSAVRGERRTYVFHARRGQQGKIVISAPENNAVFQLLLPAERTPSGAKAMMLAGPEARAWSGQLPRTGNYRIIVSGTRGNASYRLRLAID
jgi:hypothetical protein